MILSYTDITREIIIDLEDYIVAVVVPNEMTCHDYIENSIH